MFVNCLFLFGLFNLFKFSIAVCPLNGVSFSTNPNKCYYFFSGVQDFSTAERTCTEIGGHLTSVCSAFENENLRDSAVPHFQPYASKDFWIGWNDLTTKGVWNWTDPNANNANCQYNNWDSAQPGSNDCTSVSVSTGKWQGSHCSVPKAFVCEQFLAPKQPQCRDGYIYYPVWNTCYKLVRTLYTWEQAEANCNQEGGHLVSIHSADENKFVDTLIHEIGTWSWVWIGFQNSCDAGVQNCWIWTDGTPVTYTDWWSDYPRSSGTNCVQMYSSNSQWNNANTFWQNGALCYNAEYSICKQNPICI